MEKKIQAKLFYEICFAFGSINFHEVSDSIILEHLGS